VKKYRETGKCYVADRESCPHKRLGVCMANHRTSGRNRAEVERHSTSVSEVLGSSGVRDMSPKHWMYKDKLIC